jgi:integrase
MPRTIKTANLNSITSRGRLSRGRQPHWEQLFPGIHLGYQRKDAKAGRWILRRYLGSGNKYRLIALGIADDTDKANGSTILNHEQADAKARDLVGSGATSGKIARMTVRQAYQKYVEFKNSLGQEVADVRSRVPAHVLPSLGDLVVSELTAEMLRKWLSTMASLPAQVRPKIDANGQPLIQFRDEPEGDEAIRKRRATANRVLTMLKAILNHAYDEGHVTSRDAWGRKLKPFKGVNTARVRYLEISEAQRLLNASDAEFRPLVRAALETGARYGELARLEVVDFNRDSGTVSIRKSKTSKSRHIILTDEGAAFFKAHCAGRAGNEIMFTHPANGGAGTNQYTKQLGHNRGPSLIEKSPWKCSEQSRPMAEANERAQLMPRITFHGLRHTWASHAVMNGVPLLVVAKNLGHKDTKQVEHTYGHLAPSYIVDMIRAGAPKYGVAAEQKVVALR